MSPAEAEQHIKQGTATASQAILEDIGKLEQSYASYDAAPGPTTAPTPDQKIHYEKDWEEKREADDAIAGSASVATKPAEESVAATSARFGFAAPGALTTPAQALGQQFAASRPKDATPIGAAEEADPGALGELPKVAVNQTGEAKEAAGKSMG